jgi:hypothetical protein
MFDQTMTFDIDIGTRLTWLSLGIETGNDAVVSGFLL